MAQEQYGRSKQKDKQDTLMDGIIKWDNLYRVLEEAGQEIRNAYQDNLIRDNKIATGDLLNSVEYKVEHNGQAIWVELHLKDYYKYVEEGRAPGKFPPPEAILEWIRIKPVVPDERTGKLPTEEQLAFLIGRKIAEQGIEPGYQLRDAMRDNKKTFEERIDEAIAQDIEANIDVIFSTFFN